MTSTHVRGNTKAMFSLTYCYEDIDDPNEDPEEPVTGISQVPPSRHIEQPGYQKKYSDFNL